MIERIAKAVFFYIGIDGEEFVITKFTKTFSNLCFAQTNRFYFGTGEYNSGRVGAYNFVIETGAFVEYVDFFNHVTCKCSTIKCIIKKQIINPKKPVKL